MKTINLKIDIISKNKKEIECRCTHKDMTFALSGPPKVKNKMIDAIKNSFIIYKAIDCDKEAMMAIEENPVIYTLIDLPRFKNYYKVNIKLNYEQTKL